MFREAPEYLEAAGTEPTCPSSQLPPAGTPAGPAGPAPHHSTKQANCTGAWLGSKGATCSLNARRGLEVGYRPRVPVSWEMLSAQPKSPNRVPLSYKLFIICLLKKLLEKADLRDPFLEYMYLYFSRLGFSVSHWLQLRMETGCVGGGQAQATTS